MLWSPALRFAAAKVLEEIVASTGELALGMVAVVAAEVRVPEVQLHLVRGSRSTVVMGFPCSSPGLRINATVAINPGTDITSALRR